MAGKRLEPCDRTAVPAREAERVGERAGARELREHLAVPGPGDVDAVEERRDRGVVPREQLQALDWVVELVFLASLGRRHSQLKTTEGAERSTGPWKTASTFVPSGSSTNAA